MRYLEFWTRRFNRKPVKLWFFLTHFGDNKPNFFLKHLSHSKYLPNCVLFTWAIYFCFLNCEVIIFYLILSQFDPKNSKHYKYKTFSQCGETHGRWKTIKYSTKMENQFEAFFDFLKRRSSKSLNEACKIIFFWSYIRKSNQIVGLKNYVDSIPLPIFKLLPFQNLPIWIEILVKNLLDCKVWCSIDY